MFSVISVFNDKDVLTNRLLRGLQKQQATDFELITVDNRDGRFACAAAALNYGAREAKGEWLMFVHQDVELLSNDWLASAEHGLNDIKDYIGWTGVAGMNDAGVFRGILRDRACLLGQPFTGFAEVQTLDECLLIHARDKSSSQHYFDERLDGWHAYGIEACCRAVKAGKRNCVIGLAVWHDSKSTNLARLADAQTYVWRKHADLKRIYTTCGTLPDDVEAPPEQNALRVKRDETREWLTAKINRARNVLTRRVEAFTSEALNDITADAKRIEVLHTRNGMNPIDAASFLPDPPPGKIKIIRHNFCGMQSSTSDAEYVVIAADLGNEIINTPSLAELLKSLRSDGRKLLLCVDADKLSNAVRRDLQSSAKMTYRIVKATRQPNYDGAATTIITFDF